MTTENDRVRLLWDEYYREHPDEKRPALPSDAGQLPEGRRLSWRDREILALGGAAIAKPLVRKPRPPRALDKQPKPVVAPRSVVPHGLEHGGKPDAGSNS